MVVKPRQWDYLSEVFINESGADRLPGIDFHKLFAEIKEFGITHIQLTVTEVIDWDRAPMRKYLHGVVIPAFQKKYNETCKHPKNGHFTLEEVKGFLKAKFLGWNKQSGHYSKWEGVLGLNKPIPDIFAYLTLCELVGTLQPPVEPASSEGLTVEQYFVFLDDCEKYFFELFHEMWDVRERPVL